MSKPIVPEVSLIFEDTNKVILSQESQPRTYKEWKQHQQQQQQQPLPTVAKLASNQTSTNDRRKIVTFDLPVDTQPTKILPISSSGNNPIAICQQLDLSMCEPSKNDNSGAHSFPANGLTATVRKQQSNNHFVQHQYNKNNMMTTQPYFDEMYNRMPVQQLNYQMLSENQNNSNNNNNHKQMAKTKEITLNEIYQLLQNMQLGNQSSTNERNDLNQLNARNHEYENHQQLEHLSVTPNHLQSSSATVGVNNGEPTMRDMFNIIVKQQEQLMNVQNQVHVLLMRSANPQNHAINDRCSAANQIDSHTKQVGVMTSLEINVQNYKPTAAQPNVNHFTTPIKNNQLECNQRIKSCGCMCNCEPQRQQQSSDSGSDDVNFNTSPKQDDSKNGWTFYGNILNQVNDVLQNTPPGPNVKTSNENQHHQMSNIRNSTENVPMAVAEIPMRRQSNVMPNIRSAQFKQVGFQIDDVNISTMTKRYVPCKIYQFQMQNRQQTSNKCSACVREIKHLVYSNRSGVLKIALIHFLSRITFGSSSNEIPRTPSDQIASTDNSVLMNALAMKYLPCDLNNSQSPKLLQNGATHTAQINAHNAIGATANGITANRLNDFDCRNINTDMSITSYRYMEKYGLL